MRLERADLGRKLGKTVGVMLVVLGMLLPARRVWAGSPPGPPPPPPSLPFLQTPTPAISTPPPTVRPLSTPHPRPSSTPRPAGSPARYLVLIVLDGGQPGYVKVPGTPYLHQLLAEGTVYRNAWAGILESETPSGHATIATGSPPRNDGILSFAWATQDNIKVNLFSTQTVRNGVLERFMRQAGAPTIAGLVHRTHPGARVVALSGYKYYAADAIGGPDADVIMYYDNRSDGKFAPTAIPGHVPPPGVMTAPGLIASTRKLPLGVGDHLAMELAASAFRRMRQEVTLINLPEFDWPLGHVDGAGRDHHDVVTLMQSFDRDLGMLENVYRQAGVLNSTLFIVTADHGFSTLTHQVPRSAIAAAVAAAGTHLVAETWHTGAYLWLADKSKAPDVAARIAGLHNPFIQSVYYRTERFNSPTYTRASDLRNFRTPAGDVANQYLLSSFSGPNSPDVVVLFTEGAAAVAGGQSKWRGDHGGADWNSQHILLLLAGPGVRHGSSAYPAPLMDVAPTALTLLGVPYTGMQGVPLADAMARPAGNQIVAEAAQGQVLVPLEQDDWQESHRELKGR